MAGGHIGRNVVEITIKRIKICGLLTLYIQLYIVIYAQTVLMYHNFSVWLDTQDAASWDRNLPDFTSVGYLTVSKGILRIYLFTYTLIGYQCAQFVRRALHLRVFGNRQFPIRVLNLTWVGEHIYCHPHEYLKNVWK